MDALKVGYIVTFVGNWAESKALFGKYYRILRKEPLIYITNEGDTTEFATVATGADSGFKDIEKLEPETHQLYQLRPGVKDGCRYFPRLTGKDRYGPALDIDMAYFTNQDSFYTAPTEDYEFFLVKDMFPSYKATNDTGSTITPQIFFRCWQYDYEQATEYSVAKRPPEYTPITLGGLK